MLMKDEYEFLSNMYPCTVKISYNGQIYTFACSESAYQAMKCPERIDEFTRVNGYYAKRMGRAANIRPDWNDVRIDIMRTILRAKFTQNPELMRKLREVDCEIVEDNTWHDTFWGRCKGVGENWLGKLLMEIRDDASIIA